MEHRLFLFLFSPFYYQVLSIVSDQFPLFLLTGLPIFFSLALTATMIPPLSFDFSLLKIELNPSS